MRWACVHLGVPHVSRFSKGGIRPEATDLSSRFRSNPLPTRKMSVVAPSSAYSPQQSKWSDADACGAAPRGAYTFNLGVPHLSRVSRGEIRPEATDLFPISLKSAANAEDECDCDITST